jgi:hypothetical protein
LNHIATQKNRSKKSFFQHAQMEEFAFKYKHGENSFEETSQKIQDESGSFLNPSRFTITTYWDTYSMDWHRPFGKKSIPINPLIEKNVLELSNQPLHRGLHKMHETIIQKKYADIHKVSQMDVKKVFTKHKLYTGNRKPQPKKPKRCRYQADYANMIWHTDLHLFHHKKNVIVWIDDKSRIVLKHKFLDDKKADTVKEALIEVLSVYPQPYTIWTDNGTEFKGVLDDYLDDKGIIHIRTDAYNPEQNGKCERFWQTLEHANDEEQVPALLEDYNDCPHVGLPMINDGLGNRHMSPKDIWGDPELHFSPEKQPTWTVNQKTSIPFP